MALTLMPIVFVAWLGDARPSHVQEARPWVQMAAMAGLAGTGGAFATIALAVLTQAGRYKVLRVFGSFPFFSRVEKDQVLAHDTRQQLYEYIRSNPGPSFSDLRRALSVANGTLVHHLRVLEAQEFVKPVRDGFRTRFYVRGPRLEPTPYLTRTQQALLEAIRANPGIAQKDLARLIGLPRESIFYHAARLERAGELQIAREGRRARYFARASPSAA